MARLKEMFNYMTQAVPYIDETNRVLLRCVNLPSFFELRLKCI